MGEICHRRNFDKANKIEPTALAAGIWQIINRTAESEASACGSANVQFIVTRSMLYRSLNMALATVADEQAGGSIQNGDKIELVKFTGKTDIVGPFQIEQALSPR